MTTLIGDKERFGFAYSLDDNCGGAWMFGKCCYFIDGKEVGDFSVGTSLRDVYLQMTHIVTDCGHRICESLCELSDTRVFETLRYLLYDDYHDNVTHIARDIENPARFDVRIPVDVFNDWSLFLLDCDIRSRLIFKRLDEKHIQSATVSRGDFDRVILETHRNLGKLYDEVSAQEECGNSTTEGC